MLKKKWRIYFNKVLELIPGAKGTQAPATYERFAEVAKEFDGANRCRCFKSNWRCLLAGSEEAINRLEAVENAGVDTMSCWFRMGDMEHKKVMRTMKRFADEVLTIFQISSSKANCL